MITNDELNTLNLSPTNKDYYQIWTELLETASKISERWDPSSTNEADPGIVLLKVLTAIADKINYNIDKNILEAFMPTAAQDESMKRLCDMLGYKIGYYKSATTEAIIRYSGNLADLPDNNERLPDEGLTIPAFTAMSNEDKSIYYLTTRECKLTNEETIVYVPCIEGQRIKCTPSNNSTVGLVNLDANNRFYLPETQVAENGIFVYGTVDSNKTCIWERVNNLNIIPNNTKAYSFGYDSKENKPYIQFPSDISFLIEDGLEIYYIRTSGASGNISARTLTSLEKPTTEEWANYADNEKFTVTNASPALNGKNPETVDQAYKSFKKTVGTFDTLVTCRDYMNKIYQLIDEAGNNLVSNVMVADIRDDINRAHTLCSFSDYGIVYIEKPNTTVMPTTDLTKVTTDFPIDHFDIVLYPFKAYQHIGTLKDYNNSFKYTDLKMANITTQLDDYKTISHVIQAPQANELACIKNYLKLNARISTQYKVSTAEEILIIENIKKALFDAFNMRELDFGEEIPYETILKVMEQADNKIKDIVLDEPVLYTKFVTVGGKEYDTATSIEGKFLYNKLAMRNILSGRVELFNYTTDFGLNIGEAQYSDADYSPLYPASTVPAANNIQVEINYDKDFDGDGNDDEYDSPGIRTAAVESATEDTNTSNFIGNYNLICFEKCHKIVVTVSADGYIIADIDGKLGSDQKMWAWVKSSDTIKFFGFDETESKFKELADKTFELDTNNKLKSLTIDGFKYNNVAFLSEPEFITNTKISAIDLYLKTDVKAGTLTFLSNYAVKWENINTENSDSSAWLYSYDLENKITLHGWYDELDDTITPATIEDTIKIDSDKGTITLTIKTGLNETTYNGIIPVPPTTFKLRRTAAVAPAAEEIKNTDNSGVTGGVTRVTDNKINRLRTECFKDISELAGSDKTLTLQPNEVIKFRAPSLKTMTPYAAYINYFLKLDTTRKVEAEAARFLSLDDIWNLPIQVGKSRSDTIFPGGAIDNPSYTLISGMCYLNKRRLKESTTDPDVIIDEVNKTTFEYSFSTVEPTVEPVDANFYYNRLFQEEKYNSPVSSTVDTDKSDFDGTVKDKENKYYYYRLSKNSLHRILNNINYTYTTSDLRAEEEQYTQRVVTEEDITNKTAASGAFTYKTNLACFKGKAKNADDPDILIIFKCNDLKEFNSYEDYITWLTKDNGGIKSFFNDPSIFNASSKVQVFVSLFDNTTNNAAFTSNAFKTDKENTYKNKVVQNPLPPDASEDLVKLAFPKYKPTIVGEPETEWTATEQTYANLIAYYPGFKYRDKYWFSIPNASSGEVILEQKNANGSFTEANAEDLFFEFTISEDSDGPIATTFGDSFIEYMLTDYTGASEISELLLSDVVSDNSSSVINTKSTVWGTVINTQVPIGAYVDWWYNVNVHEEFQKAYQKSCLYIKKDDKYVRLSRLNKFYSKLTSRRAFVPGQYLLFEPQNDAKEVFPVLQAWASEFQGYTVPELQEELGQIVDQKAIKTKLNTVGYTLGERVNPDDKKAQEGKYIYRNIGSNIDRNIGKYVDSLLNKYMPATRADASGVGVWSTYFWPAPQAQGKELRYTTLGASKACWFQITSKYQGSSLGTDSVLVSIQPNEEYQLRKGEALFINYTPSGNSANSNTASDTEAKPVNLAYGPGTIIKPIGSGFTLEDSMTKFNSGIAPWAKTTGFDFHAYGELGGNDVVGMYSIDPNSQIDIRDFIKVELKDSVNLYWILKKTRLITKNKPYTLQDDEYIFYTDKHKIDMAYYGAGTEIRVTGDNQRIRLSTDIEQVDLQEIMTKGISAVPWRTVYLKKGEDIQLQEYQYITLVEGDTIKGLTLDHDTTFMRHRADPNNKLIRKSYRLVKNPNYDKFRKRAIKNKKWIRYSKWYPAYVRAEIIDYLDNTWAPVDPDTPCLYAVAGTDIMSDAIELPKFNIASFDTTGESLGQGEPLRWEVRSILELNVGPTTAQTLYPGHSIKMQNEEQSKRSDEHTEDLNITAEDFIPVMTEISYIEKETFEEKTQEYKTQLYTTEVPVFDITTPVGNTPEEQVTPLTIKTNYPILTTRDSIDVGLTILAAEDDEETETAEDISFDEDLTEDEIKAAEEAERQEKLKKAAEIVNNFKIKIYEDDPVQATLLEVGQDDTPILVPNFDSLPDSNGIYATKLYNTKTVSEVAATETPVTLNNFNSVWTSLGPDVFKEPQKIGESNIAGATIKGKVTVPAVQIASVVPENHYNLLMVYYQAPQDLPAAKGMGFRFYPLTKYNIETNYVANFTLTNITTDENGNIIESEAPAYLFDCYVTGLTTEGNLSNTSQIILYDETGVPVPENQAAIRSLYKIDDNIICTDYIIFNGERYDRDTSTDSADTYNEDACFYNTSHRNVTKRIKLNIITAIESKQLTAYEYNLDSDGKLVKIFNHINLDDLNKFTCLDNTSFDEARHLSAQTLSYLTDNEASAVFTGYDKFGNKAQLIVDGQKNEVTLQSLTSTVANTYTYQQESGLFYGVYYKDRLYSISQTYSEVSIEKGNGLQGDTEIPQIINSKFMKTGFTDFFTTANITAGKFLRFTATSLFGDTITLDVKGTAESLIEINVFESSSAEVSNQYITTLNFDSFTPAATNVTDALSTIAFNVVFNNLFTLYPQGSTDPVSSYVADITLQNDAIAKFTIQGVTYIVNSAPEFERYFENLSWWNQAEVGLSTDASEIAFGNKQCTKTDTTSVIDATYFLRPGVNVIVFRNSGKFEFLADTELSGALYVSAIDSVLATTPDLGLDIDRLDYQWPTSPKTNLAYQISRTEALAGYEWTNTNFLRTRIAYTLLADILKRDPTHQFYYNCPLQAATAIDINTILSGEDAEKLSDARMWYEPNNINSKFVISEIDGTYLKDGLMIARASKTR